MTALEKRKKRLQRLHWALGMPSHGKLTAAHAHRRDRHRRSIQRLKNRRAGMPEPRNEPLSLIQITIRTFRIMETEVLHRISERSGVSCLLYDAIEAIKQSTAVLEAHVHNPRDVFGKAYRDALNPRRDAEMRILFMTALDDIQARPSASDERVRSWEDVKPALAEYFELPEGKNNDNDDMEEMISADPIQTITQRLEWENHQKIQSRLADAQQRYDQKKLASPSQAALSKTNYSWSKKLGLFSGSDADALAAAQILRQEKEAEAQERAQQMLRELTPEEHELVRRVLAEDGPDDDVVARTDSDIVSRKNMHTLRPGEWLSDEIIHFFLAMLAKRDEELCNEDATRLRTHFFKSFFMTKITNEGHQNPAIEGTYEYRNVKRWSKKVPGKDIFCLDKIVFPINVGGVHWTCAVAFMQDKRIQYYDSFVSVAVLSILMLESCLVSHIPLVAKKGGEGWPYLETIKRYIEDEHEDKKKFPLPDTDEWKLIPCQPDTPRQKNGYDCGVFTCMFADFISKDCPLVFTQDHVNQCRERIALSILKGKAIL